MQMHLKRCELVRVQVRWMARPRVCPSSARTPCRPPDNSLDVAIKSPGSAAGCYEVSKRRVLKDCPDCWVKFLANMLVVCLEIMAPKHNVGFYLTLKQKEI